MNANALITQLNNPAVLLKINQRSAITMSVLLVVACAYLLVEVTWMFFPQDDVAVVSVQKKTGQVVGRGAQQNKFRQLTQANIFGVSQRTAVARQAVVPVTKLNLTLKGVLAAVPMKHASAIISQGKSGKEDIYGIGDKIPGGVLIKEIHPEHVVLERNGQREILKLQKISGVNFKRTNTARNNELSSGSASSAGVALKKIRKDILKNPASFGDYALPILVRENGKQIGYRLKPQKKGALLADLGIQPGDVIIQINGVKLNKPQNGISALRKLSTARNINMVVKRDGAEIPLNITLP